MTKLGIKINQANKIIGSCIGNKGVWASARRYRHQCWTRDFTLAIAPVLMHSPDIKIGMEVVRTHLLEIARRQRPSGKVPILFLDDEIEFLRDKITKSIKTGSMSFMLERYLDQEIENLTPHTRDGNALFILTVAEFLELNPDPLVVDELTDASLKALNYIKTILSPDGLIISGDWRDVREDLDDKCVLTNQCLLYRAYNVLNRLTDAKHVKRVLQEKYWNGKYFIDYPETDNFDILGNALAIIYDIANAQQRNLIFKYVVENLSTPYGFKLCDTFLPPLNEKEKECMDRDHAVMWPWINGMMLNAMIEKGGIEWYGVAEKEFDKWIALDGFNEWYDLVDGCGYGSVEQTWSAALFLQVSNNLLKYRPNQ